MSKTNKTTVKQAVLEAIDLKNSIKEESKDILRSMLGETVKDAIRESIEDDDDSYEVVDNDTDSENSEEEPEVTDVQSEDEPEESEESEDNSEDTEEDEEEPKDDETEEDGWDEFDEYQTGDDDTYDLTGEEDYDQIVKVYKLMKDDDQVVVKQEGDKIELTDNETGNEYVISIGMNGNESIEDGEEEDLTTESVVNEETDIAGIPDNDSIEFELDDLADEADNDESILNDEQPRFEESKKMRKTMKERKEKVYEVSLGYTDNYQDKDPIQGLSMSEPSKSGKSWEKGVPTGTEKPWAGSSKDKGEPFEKTVEEGVEECNEETVEEGVAGAVKARTTAKDHAPNNRKEYLPKKARHISTADEGYDEMVDSLKEEISKLKKINEAYKKENLALKKGVRELKENVKESYVVNANLAKITRLFTENAVSLNERKEIVNRFANEAKTVEQSKALYESIDKELKKNNKQITLENKIPSTVGGSQVMNENKYKSQELLNTLDLIKRVENR